RTEGAGRASAPGVRVAAPEPTESVAEPASASTEPAAEVEEEEPAARAQPQPRPQPAPVAQRPTSGGPAGAGGTRPADDRPPSRPGDSGKVLSPVVRRLIAEHGLDPAQIQGTGAGGRITRADV